MTAVEDRPLRADAARNVERILRAGVAFLGAVAKADGPFGGVTHVIGHFLHRLGGDGGERLVCRARQRLVVRMGEGGVEQLPHHRIGEVAVRLLDQQQVSVIAGVAQIGEGILVAALAFDLAGIGIERARLTDEVEAHIAEGEILLDHRRMPDPFGQAMAEDQRRVGEPQGVLEQRYVGHGLGRCFDPSP